MNNVVMTVVSALSQVILFSLIPFIAWLIWQRKKVSFPEYVGLKKPKRTASWWIIIPLFAVYFVIYSFDVFAEFEITEGEDGNKEAELESLIGFPDQE